MSSSSQATSSKSGVTRSISITSGKGGVGKSTMVANLAAALSRSGRRVLMLDGDLGMANLDIMFGRRAQQTIHHVLFDGARIEDVIMNVAPNLDLIPGGSGIYELQRLPPALRQGILDQVSELPNNYDYLLIDTAPGIDDNVLYLNAAANEIMVVVTPDPSSLTDAYSLIKVLNQRHRENKFSILCNMVRDDREAMAVFQRLSEVADRFLCVSLTYRGFVPMDSGLQKATKLQQLALDFNPRLPASLSIQQIAKKLNGFENVQEVKGGIQFFWQQLVGVA
jgi:flagellar biosynthesis protein FlhG